MIPVTPLGHFLYGAIALACVVIAVLFLKFYRRTGDRLLQLFGIAFLLLAVERVLLVAVPLEFEARSSVYWIRLLAFTIVVVGIVFKNRTQSTVPRSAEERSSSEPLASNAGFSEPPAGAEANDSGAMSAPREIRSSRPSSRT